MKCIEIVINFTNHYKLSVHISDSGLLERLKKYFETRDMIVFKTRGKNPILRRELKISKLWSEETEESILIDAGLVDYLVAWIGRLDKETYNVDLEIDLPHVKPVELNERWKGILRDNQKEDVLTLTRYYGGLAALPTGYGKSLTMLGIAQMIQGTSLILVPNSGILSEIKKRGKEFNVHVAHYEWNEKNNIEIINPIGFLRSKESEKLKAYQWLEKVENVFTDEAHYLQAKSWDEVFIKYLPNVKRAYGFSASPDSKSGKHLTPAKVGIRELGYRSSKIIGLSGTTRVRRKSTSNMTLIEVTSEITPEIGSKSDTWQEALDLMIKRPECARVIYEIIKRCPSVKFYIPVITIESGKILYVNLTNYGIDGIFWRSGEVLPLNAEDDELASVRKMIYEDTKRFLISTSVAYEGIDLPVLTGVIPLVGKSYRLVIQPAGRASRCAEIVYVLIHDKHNKIMKNQTKERKRIITNEYEVSKKVKWNI